jgi:dipeptidyl aminopeptidase/acylaminoacyl peptidase
VASVATIAAVAHPGRRARALPAAERERWRREGSYDFNGMQLGTAFLDDVERLDVLERVRSVRCPAFLAHGTADEVVPVGDAVELAGRLAGRCEIHRYESADHRFSEPALLRAMLADVTAWTLAALEASGAAATSAGDPVPATSSAPRAGRLR